MRRPKTGAMKLPCNQSGVTEKTPDYGLLSKIRLYFFMIDITRYSKDND